MVCQRNLCMSSRSNTGRLIQGTSLYGSSGSIMVSGCSGFVSGTDGSPTRSSKGVLCAGLTSVLSRKKASAIIHGSTASIRIMTAIMMVKRLGGGHAGLIRSSLRIGAGGQQCILCLIRILTLIKIMRVPG